MTELGVYLKARRANVTPEDVDLPRNGTRRVPGLRREEVASLAGLSVDYYTRLEQGREQHPSPSVLNALARALRLGPDAQRYLFAIATPGPRVARGHRQLSQTLLDLLDDWTDHPAVIIDDCYNIVAANHLGRAIYAGHQHSDNLARLLFLDPDGRTFFRDWTKVASTTVAAIRAAAAHDSDNSDLMALVGELTVRSTEFANRWAKAEVQEKTSGTTCYHHPIVGDLELRYESLRPSGSAGLLLKVFRAEKGSEMSEKLAVLGSLTAEPHTQTPDSLRPSRDR
ncbi:transcriptional regulator with XRE-family HTH domain [Kibdelosporangium banguiense]|uniref:Transcriptional regulator with XRE-family HTH domain n=1 Tax=Kibdelosporangium banguiense TaxID=1365924 RepID=A0ABS4TR40_9PSEU|nr:helix-turn-helix transcriptional regulator [Kibdelosporangium banguiense]MBP2326878.1 transcriptional regulator with XRE-family HTH domain [Kibdelosporangium banguiense]